MPDRDGERKSKNVGAKRALPAAKSGARARTAAASDRVREKPRTPPSAKDGGGTRKRGGGAGPAKTPPAAGMPQTPSPESGTRVPAKRSARTRKPRSPDRPGRFEEKAGFQETRNRGDDPRGLSRTGRRAGPRGGGSDDRNGPKRR